VYDSSCSPEARVYYIERDGGYFLKCASSEMLEKEATLGDYFHKKGLGAPVLAYRSEKCDWLLTGRICGEDATDACYLREPRRLAILMGELLRSLHECDVEGCPVPHRLEDYFATVEEGYCTGRVDLSFGEFESAEHAYRVAMEGRELLREDTLVHGDFCLPNFLLDDWRFTGFIDVGNGGVADRHIDLFWGAWTLNFNLKTDDYRDVFFDAYGRDRVDADAIRVVSACEIFG
jgi:kanamycin kinase